MWQYWRHSKSGEVWAVLVETVMFDDDTTVQWVSESCGPLHHSEVTKGNLRDGNFNGVVLDAEWIREREDEFVQHEVR